MLDNYQERYIGAQLYLACTLTAPVRVKVEGGRDFLVDNLAR